MTSFSEKSASYNSFRFTLPMYVAGSPAAGIDKFLVELFVGNLLPCRSGSYGSGNARKPCSRALSEFSFTLAGLRLKSWNTAHSSFSFAIISRTASHSASLYHSSAFSHKCSRLLLSRHFESVRNDCQGCHCSPSILVYRPVPSGI